MPPITARIAIAAALSAWSLSSRTSQAQTSPGLNASFISIAYNHVASAAPAPPSTASHALTLTPIMLHDDGEPSSSSESSSPLSHVDAGNAATNAGGPPPAPLSLTADLSHDDAMNSWPSTVTACACGCGIFEVGTSSMFPQGQGGTIFLEYDFQSQNRNWRESSRAPSADNADKVIRTHFITPGLQYMVDRSWGFEVEVPYDIQHFETTGGASGSDPVSLDWATLGDIRIEGIYTGFFPDLSAGLNFGFKLPTGSFKHNDTYGDIDRDTEIGTGSTDVLLGGFYRHRITADNLWTWFGQINTDLPMFTQDGYRPGAEIDAAAGIYYSGLSIGKLNITPLAQVLASERTIDSGPNAAHPVASGYQRLLLSPGLELNFHPFMVYGDVEVPVYQYMNGDQLVAPVLFKLVVSYSF